MRVFDEYSAKIKILNSIYYKIELFGYKNSENKFYLKDHFERLILGQIAVKF